MGDRLQLAAHGKFRQASREIYIFSSPAVGIHGQGGQEYLSDVHRKSLGLLGI